MCVCVCVCVCECTRSIDKNSQMCPNRPNIHVLFNRQSVSEMGLKQKKVLLEEGNYNRSREGGGETNE